MAFKVEPRQKLLATILLYICFFVAELGLSLKTRSLALTADAFHYLNDLVGFIIAFAAIVVNDRDKLAPASFTYGWQRAPILGAFFNGVLLLALGFSIFFQSLERFMTPQTLKNPEYVLYIGCAGLALNLLSVALLHEYHGHSHGHSHIHHAHQISDQGAAISSPPEIVNIDSMGRSPAVEHPPPVKAQPGNLLTVVVQYLGHHSEHAHFKKAEAIAHHRDLGILGVVIHVACDALNNIGVIIAAVVIKYTDGKGTAYADPAVSLFISLMIVASAYPLIKRSGAILLQTSPDGLDVKAIRADLEAIPGIDSIHELHIWRVNENKAVVSAHLVMADDDLASFMSAAQIARQCLHAYGLHSATLEPEFPPKTVAEDSKKAGVLVQCQGVCSAECESLGCSGGSPTIPGV